MVRRLIRNVVSNWMGDLAVAAVAFVLTPYVIRMLKDPALENQRYGEWTFIIASIAYFQLADLGFFQGVLQYFTRYRAQGRTEAFNRVVSTAVAALLMTAAVAIVLAAVVAWSLPRWAALGGLPIGEIRLVFFVAALGIILGVPLEIFNGVLIGCQAFPVFNTIKVVTRLVAAGAVVLTLASGGGLLGMAVATAAIQFGGQLLSMCFAFRLEPKLELRARYVDRATLGELVRYGRWMFGNRITNLHLANVDMLIVPLLFGIEVGAVYGLAHSFVLQASALVSGYAYVLTPPAIVADACHDDSPLRAILLKGSRIGLLLGGLFAVGFYFWGEQFIFQWLGDPSFLWEATHASAATILVVIALDRVVLSAIAGPPQTLIARRHVSTLSFIQLGQGIVGLVVAWIAGMLGGVLAVPWALAAVALVSRATMTVLACRVSRVRVVTFLAEAIAPAVLTLGVTALACVGIRHAVTLPGWPGLAVKMLLTLLVAAVAGIFLCLDRSDRRRVADAARLRWLRPAGDGERAG